MLKTLLNEVYVHIKSETSIYVLLRASTSDTYNEAVYLFFFFGAQYTVVNTSVSLVRVRVSFIQKPFIFLNDGNVIQCLGQVPPLLRMSNSSRKLRINLDLR